MNPAPLSSEDLQSLPLTMKEKAQSGDTGNGTRKVSGSDKGARLIPSRTWGQGARALWRSLSFRERALMLMGVLVPALDQISRLASLGVTMKAVGMGIRQPLDLEERIWLALIILAATGVSALIAIFSTWVKKNLKILVTRIARRIYGRMMAATTELPLEERKAEVATLMDEERNFINSATSGVLDLIDFIAAISLVVVLLVILTWFNWIVGVIILVAGLVALLILKFKIKSSPRKENEDSPDARKKLTQQLESIAGSRKNTESIIEDYANNEFDRITFAELEAKTRLQKKISSMMGFGSAILMAFVFFLVSAKGAFDEEKVVWMVVFIFGLRMVVAHGKSAMVDWGSILGEKETLMALAKAAIEGRNREVEKIAFGPVDSAKTDHGFSGIRVIEFSVVENPFSGRGYALETLNDRPKVADDPEAATPDKLGGRILVVGDGHVRQYAGNPNFLPVFLGPAPTHNFTSDPLADAYQQKAESVISSVLNNCIVFVLGEPDCRWALGRGWVPWDPAAAVAAQKTGGLPTLPDESLDSSVYRVASMVTAVSTKYSDSSFFVAPVFPSPRPEVNVLVGRLNERLQRSLGDVFLAGPDAVDCRAPCFLNKVYRGISIQRFVERELHHRGFSLMPKFN